LGRDVGKCVLLNHKIINNVWDNLDKLGISELDKEMKRLLIAGNKKQRVIPTFFWGGDDVIKIIEINGWLYFISFWWCLVKSKGGLLITKLASLSTQKQLHSLHTRFSFIAFIVFLEIKNRFQKNTWILLLQFNIYIRINWKCECGSSIKG